MKIKEIADKHGTSVMFLNYILHGKRHTTDINLAIDMAQLMNIKPITLISPKLRKQFLKWHPSLSGKKG